MPEPLEFQVVADLQDIVRELKDITSAQKGLTSAVKESESAAGGFTSRLNQMSQAMSQARAQTQGMREASRGLMLIGAGGAAISASFVTAAARMETMRAGLKAVAGSSTEAEKQLASLKELAKSPAFSLESALQGSVRLQQAGMSAKQAEDAMKGLAAALVAAGRGPAELDRATVALSQMALKGKISQEEINQLAEAGVNVGAILREQFNLTSKDMENLGKAFQERGLSANDVILKMTDTLQQKWGPAAKDAGNTASNAFANFGDAVFQARAALGESLIPTVTKATQAITGLLENVNKWDPSIREAAAGTLVGVSGMALLGGAALNVAANIAQVRIAAKLCAGAEGVGLLTRALGGLKIAFGFLTVSGNPIVIAIYAIGGAITYLASTITNELDKSLKSAKTQFDEFAKLGAIQQGQGPPEFAWWQRWFTPNAVSEATQAWAARPTQITGKAPGLRPVTPTTPPKAGPTVDLGAIAHSKTVEAEIQLRLARDTERELAARQQKILALQEELKYAKDGGEKEQLRLKIADEMADRTALIRENIHKQQAEEERARKKAEQEEKKRQSEWEQVQRKREQEYWRQVQLAEQWREAERDIWWMARANSYEQAKKAGNLALMQQITDEAMQAAEYESQEAKEAYNASNYRKAGTTWLRLRNQLINDTVQLEEKWAEAAKKQQESAERSAEKQRQLMERIGDAVERRIKAEEDAIARKEDRERSVRERAARWYQDVAQQAAKLGNLPMAREFAARGGQLAQEAAGMGVMTGTRDIGRGGEFAARGLDQLLGAFGQGNFSQADVYAMSRWVEQGVMGAGGPEQRNWTALPTGAVASTLAPQQVVNIFVGEYAIATQADPTQVGQWFQTWYNQQVARQQVSAPR